MDRKPGELFPSTNWQHAKHPGFMAIQVIPKYKGEAIWSPNVRCRMSLPHTTLLPYTDLAHSQSKVIQLCQHQRQNEHLALPGNTSGDYSQPKITYPTKASRNRYFFFFFLKESEKITKITWGHSWTCLWSLVTLGTSSLHSAPHFIHFWDWYSNNEVLLKSAWISTGRKYHIKTYICFN